MLPSLVLLSLFGRQEQAAAAVAAAATAAPRVWKLIPAHLPPPAQPQTACCYQTILSASAALRHSAVPPLLAQIAGSAPRAAGVCALSDARATRPSAQHKAPREGRVRASVGQRCS